MAARRKGQACRQGLEKRYMKPILIGSLPVDSGVWAEYQRQQHATLDAEYQRQRDSLLARSAQLSSKEASIVITSKSLTADACDTPPNA